MTARLGGLTMGDTEEDHVSGQFEELLPGVDLVPRIDLPQVGALSVEQRLLEGLDVTVSAHRLIRGVVAIQGLFSKLYSRKVG